MKKIICPFIVYLIFFSSLIAQSFAVHIADTVKNGQPGDEIALGGIIVNLTAADLEIVMNRATNEIPSDWSTSMCFENCAPPWIDQLTGTVAANDSLEFGVHFFTSQTPGQGQALIEISQAKVQTASFLFKASTNSSGIADYHPQAPSLQLLKNFPNPFNSETKIRFYGNAAVKKVKFTVFSLNGEIVRESRQDITGAGFHDFIFSATNADGGELANGIYIYRLDYFSAQGFVKSQSSRFILLK
ncbi:MAG: hypothetical protein GXO74_12900 [Calditrichaeota bacterium]|nr:hypothetical protein [Calditrichota bacterium]